MWQGCYAASQSRCHSWRGSRAQCWCPVGSLLLVQSGTPVFGMVPPLVKVDRSSSIKPFWIHPDVCFHGDSKSSWQWGTIQPHSCCCCSLTVSIYLSATTHPVVHRRHQSSLPTPATIEAVLCAAYLNLCWL